MAPFDPFQALRALTLLVLAGGLLVWRLPGLARRRGQVGMWLAAAYLLGGVAIFVAAYLV